jgi:DnaA N-terminal domain
MTELGSMNPANPWEATLTLIKSRVAINTFQCWFAPTRFLGTQGTAIRVLLPTDTFFKVLTHTYGEIIKVCLPKEYDSVRYEIGPDYPTIFTERDIIAPGLLLLRRAEELEEIARQLRNLAERVYP